MSSGGTNTVTQSGPPPEVLANYQQVYGQAKNVANQPSQPYAGPLVAGFTPLQEAGFNNINTAVNAGQPFLDEASKDVANSTSLLDPSNFGGTVAQYQSPYTDKVVAATEAQFNNQNQQQQQQLAGNAASRGAFGGDREAVAQAILAGQQQTQEAPVIANLYNTGFQNATNAAQSNAWLNSQGGFSMGNLGNEAESLGLTGANAQLTAGGTQQQFAQQELNIPYESYLAAQAYPFQTTGWLSGLAEGTGSLSGGTSGTTTPPPSALSQIGGLGLSGIGAYGMLNNAGLLGSGVAGTAGAFGAGAYGAAGLSDATLAAIGSSAAAASIPADAAALAAIYRHGGRVPHLANGGNPADPLSFAGGIPDVSVTLVPFGASSGQRHGAGPPRAPQAAPPQDPLQSIGGMSGLADLGRMIRSTDASYAESRGGRIPGFAPGGAIRSLGMDFGRPMIPRHLDAGGNPGASTTPAGLTASVGGNPALVQLQESYAGLPTEQLQELSARFRPNSPQGALVQRALRMRQMNPQSDPAQPNVPSPQPQGGFGPAPQMFADGGAPDDAETPLDFGPGPGDSPLDFTSPMELTAATPTQGTVGGFGPPPPPAPGTRQGGFTPAPAHGASPGRTDPWETLLAAGLGIMSGTSKFPLVNIGRGGAEGLQFMSQQRQLAAQDALRRQQAEWQNDYRQAMVQNAANRNDIAAQRANTYATLSQASASQKMAMAALESARAASAGASHVTEGDVLNKAVASLADGKTINPDTGQPWTLADAMMHVKGVDTLGKTRQQNADNGTARVDIAKQLGDARLQAMATARDDKTRDLIERATESDMARAVSMVNGSKDIMGKPQLTLEQALGQIAQARPTAAPGRGAARTAATPPAATPAAPALPPLPKSLPPGSQYSPSRQMWRDPSGKLYDQTGIPVR